MARGADVVHGTRADATRHARPRGKAEQAHATRRWRASGAQVRTGGADAWHGRRESTQTPGWHHVAWGLAGEGPMGYWALV